MIVVRACASITHQDSFQKQDIQPYLKPLDQTSEVIAPDYKTYIPPAALRRLSPVLRMALAAATDCQQQIGTAFDAISVGTALGCLKDTERFLETFHTATGDTLSPTAFIQSTHNTIGGQISLALNNHAYNMTHTQNSLSFEVALLDAIICVREGKEHVLVGAADEAIDFLELLRPTVIQSPLPFTSGASFFVLGKDAEDGVKLLDCAVHFEAIETQAAVSQFLKKNGIAPDELSFIAIEHTENIGLEGIETLEYGIYTGLYYSSSAFGFHILHDFLKNSLKKYALLINNQVQGKLGLTLLGR